MRPRGGAAEGGGLFEAPGEGPLEAPGGLRLSSAGTDSIASYETNKPLVQEANLFKRQTSMFIFQQIFHIHFMHLSEIIPSIKSALEIRESTAARLHWLLKQHGCQVVSSRQHFLDSEQTSYTKYEHK